MMSISSTFALLGLGLSGLLVGVLVWAWLYWTKKTESLLEATRLSITNETVAKELLLNAKTQIQELTQKITHTQQQLAEANETKIKAESLAQQSKIFLDQERKFLDEAKAKLNDTFRGLASQALEGNNKTFFDLAKGELTPLKELLDKYQGHLREIENSRQKSFTTIENELKRVIDTSQVLSTETRALKDALKKPHVRGRWGEIQLKNCVEMSGMSEYCDFNLQDVTETSEGKFLRPDMIVHMPGGRVVVVDSKVPLDAFLTALEATTDEARATETQRHGRQVKDHVTKLASKTYQDHVSASADFTVMFLPNESFLYAALETERNLVEYALEKKILIATPPTFVGLLKVILHGWTEEKLARNAQEISKAGIELHKRLVDFVDTFEDIGQHLKKALDHYEAGRTRLSSRVLVQARRMETLGIKGNKELPEDVGYEEDQVPPLSLIEGANTHTQ